MKRITEAVQRDLFARMRLRIEELERENAELQMVVGAYYWPGPKKRYETEEERVEARRRVWRDSKRRAKLRAA